MNFIDYRVSTCVSTEFQRINSGKTDIITLDNGDEIRNAVWKYNKLRFAASYVLLSDQSQNEITTAFYAARAQLYLFRFKDYGDYQAVNEPLTVVAGTQTPVQLVKTYRFGPASAERLIQAVVTAKINDDSGAIVAGTLDGALGLFTPESVWGTGQYTWTGEFDVWVRFGSDQLDMTMHTLDIATADVELWEMRARR